MQTDLVQETVSQIVIEKIGTVLVTVDRKFDSVPKMKESTIVRRKLTSQTLFPFLRKLNLQMGLPITRRKDIYNI